jgi:hypothetical protein
MPEQIIPYWAKLLLAWERRGGAGLTLPFITGAKTLVSADHVPTVEHARSLLEEIFAIGIPGKTICINWCGITKAYGICIIDTRLTDGIYLSTPATIFAIDLACQEFGEQPEEIIDGMTELYKEQIADQTYSITSGKWRAYDEVDKLFISNVLK